MSDLKTPFSEAACPTPDAGSGWSGTPGGLDVGEGPNGLTNSPWPDSVVPVPGGEPTSGTLPTPITMVPTDGGTHEGESLQSDIRMPPVHTIDKK